MVKSVQKEGAMMSVKFVASMSKITLLIGVLTLFVTGPAIAGDRPVRDDSGNVLIEDAAEKDIPKLVQYVVEGEGQKANLAGIYLVEFGQASVPALLDALEKGNNPVGLLFVIGQIKDERVVGPVAKLIASADAATAEQARGVLVTYGDTAVEGTLEHLRKPETFDRALGILNSLTLSSPEKAVALVRPLLKSKNPYERAAAAYLLGRWGDTGSARAIEKLIRDGEKLVQVKALQGYQTVYGKDQEKINTDLLVELLGSPDPEVRALAAGIIPKEKAVEPMLEILKKDTDERVRTAAIIKLSDIKDERTVLPLLEVVRDKAANGEQKSNAIYALGNMKSEAAVPYIMQLFDGTETPDEDVVAWSCIALREIGMPVSLSPFLPYLKKEMTDHTINDIIDLIDAYAKPGDEEVIAALETLMEAKPNFFGAGKIDSVLKRIKIK